MKTTGWTRRAKQKTNRQAPTHWLKFYKETVSESGPNRRGAIKDEA